MAGRYPKYDDYGRKGPNMLELQVTKASSFRTDDGSVSPTASVAPIIYQTKDGSRIEDGELVGEKTFKPSFKLAMALVGCSLAFAGSQMIPLFYFTLFTSIAKELGEANFVWLSAAGTLGSVAASVSLGPLSDLYGRKQVFMLGVLLSLIGMILCAATPNSAGFIAGQAIAGYGLIIEELLAIAVSAELVPSSKRTIYGAAMISGFIPWAPGTLYAQLLASMSFRWVGGLIAVWNLITLVVLGVWYNPPSRIRTDGLSRKQLLLRVDFIGMLLGLAGLIVFIIGINSGGNPDPWTSPRVVVPIAVGGGLILVFVLWEMYGAKFPLFPGRLIQAKRAFWALMFIIFAAGINFVPLAVFWPIESISVFQSGHIRTGINAVPVGICILGGAIISAGLCGAFKNRIIFIMTFFCVMQTAGVGAMALIDPQNINTAWGPLVIGLLGVGGVLFPNQIIITVITPDDLLATVTSLTFTVRSVSQVLSLALFQNRFVDQVTNNAIKFIAVPAVSAGFTSISEITDLATSLTAMPYQEYMAQVMPNLLATDPAKYEALREATVTAFGKSFPLLYYMGLAFGAAACVASGLTGDISNYMDGHVAVSL